MNGRRVYARDARSPGSVPVGKNKTQNSWHGFLSPRWCTQAQHFTIYKAHLSPKQMGPKLVRAPFCFKLFNLKNYNTDNEQHQTGSLRAKRHTWGTPLGWERHL